MQASVRRFVFGAISTVYVASMLFALVLVIP